MSARLWSISEPDDHHPQRESIHLKLTLWGLFTVLVSILPIAIIFLMNISHDSRPAPVGPSAVDVQMSHAPTYQQALGRGELLLIASAIAAGGVGEVLARGGHRKREHQVGAAGTAFLIASVCSAWFVFISSSIADGEELRLDVISWGSMVLFLFSLIAAGTCTLMAET